MMQRLVNLEPTSGRLLLACAAILLGLNYVLPPELFMISPSFAPIAHYISEQTLGSIMVLFGLLEFLAVFFWSIPAKIYMGTAGAALWAWQGTEMLLGSHDAGYVSPGGTLYLLFALAYMFSAAQTVKQEWLP